MGVALLISSSQTTKKHTTMRVLFFFGLVALAAMASAAPAPKAHQPTEYISVVDVIEAANHIKDIFHEIKNNIENGVVKGEIVDFLEHIKEVVQAKINAAKPVVAEILAKMKAAIDDMIAQIKSGIQQAKPILQQLVEKIMAKIAELKDKLIGGYNIFEDLLNDVLKPALGNAIENLIPTIQKHLKDLMDKLVPSEYMEYMALADIMEIAKHIKDVFNELKGKIESGEVKANIVDFLQHLKDVIDAKIAAAKPVVKAALEKVKAAIEDMIAKAKATAESGVESGKALLVQLMEAIMAKLGELKDNLTGYNIFEDLLNDVLKPALGNAIENLIPTIKKHLKDLMDKLVPSEYMEYMALADILEIAQHIKDVFNELKGKIESGEVKANIVDFLKHLKDVIDAKIAKAKSDAEAGIVAGKGLLVQLLEKIMAKLAE